MALKILLADDSMTAQNMGKKILVDAGYDVVAVSNGAAAIKKVASERPDIAILDEYMPGYTGSEVCERIKAAAETARIPVLLTVGKMEPFDPEKANKVRADGVMIKPFEASDLIAAVQSIAQRLLAPRIASRDIDTSVKLQSPSRYEDTERVSGPAEPDHEDTLRLTEEQIKAFQDATWATADEPHLEESQRPGTASREMTVAAGEAEPLVAMATDTAESFHAAPRESPVYRAMAASGIAAEHELFASAASPAAPVFEPSATAEETAAEPFAPAFYTAPVFSEPETDFAAPAFVEPVVPEAEESPVSVAPPEAIIVAPEAAIVEPVIEPAPAVLVEPVVEAAPEAPLASTPVLETNAPKTPGPVLVAQAADLEPTSAPETEVAAAHALGLEINSPPQEPGVVVEQDSALVTDSEGMAQFATTFGIENAEPLHVGLAADLSDAQLAAIITPEEEEAATEEPGIAQPETPAAAIESVAESTVAEEAPMVEAVEPDESGERVVTYLPEPEPAIETPVAQVEAEAAAPAVEENPAPAEVATEPVVEPTAETPVATETVTTESDAPAEAPAGFEPETEVVAAPAEIEPAAAIAAVAQMAPVTEPEPVLPTPAEHVAEFAAPEVAAHTSEAENPSQEEHVLHAVEGALAAAAVAGAFPGVARVFQEHPPVEEPAVSPETSPHVAEPQPMAQFAPTGDAALAEELAAAIARKETEERAQATADATVTATTEHAVAEASAPEPYIDAPGVTDNRLADAVARAFESLKPQLITEIIKELSK